MKGLMNPFIISGYEGAEYFCDRVAETKQLASEIANGNNVALIATRRMGKSGLVRPRTSLVLRILDMSGTMSFSTGGTI